MVKKNKRIRLSLAILFAASCLFYIFYSLGWPPQIFQEPKANFLKRWSDGVSRCIAWFRFDDKNALKRWEEKVFKDKVLYSIKLEQRQGFLHAFAHSAASGIVYRLKFDPKKEPLISWKWRILRFPDKSSAGVDTGWVEKDDYAARFYVIFPKLNILAIKSLEYVWDKTLPEGTILTNPYFKNIKIIVIESGEKNLNNWVYEERNVREDFKKAFGREPSIVGAIAVMTDSDNSLSTAEAEYDEIKVGYKNGEK
jgi:hypothetical protein